MPELGTKSSKLFEFDSKRGKVELKQTFELNGFARVRAVSSEPHQICPSVDKALVTSFEVVENFLCTTQPVHMHLCGFFNTLLFWLPLLHSHLNLTSATERLPVPLFTARVQFPALFAPSGRRTRRVTFPLTALDPRDPSN